MVRICFLKINADFRIKMRIYGKLRYYNIIVTVIVCCTIYIINSTDFMKTRRIIHLTRSSL